MKHTIFLGLLVSAAAIGSTYAQAPAAGTACGVDDVWLEGEPGPAFTVTGFRIPPEARTDGGVTFCIRGVVVTADETTMIARDGNRIFTLNGTVTLTMPDRSR